jgi:hypothetical protein
MLGRDRFMTLSPEGTNERAVGRRGQTRARRLLGRVARRAWWCECRRVSRGPVAHKNGEGKIPPIEESFPGVRKSSYLVTWNFRLLRSVAFGVVTVTNPVVALAGTTAVMYVADTKVDWAALPLNDTLLVVAGELLFRP